MKDSVIISAVRTPIGKFQGALKSMSATQLGALVVHAAVERAGLKPEEVGEVIMGNVVSAGRGQNPARQAALRGGLLPDVAAMTINKVCGSGLKAVGLAAQGIQTGDSEIVVAGGMESMTNAPYLLPGAREGYRLGHNTIVDSMIHDGLWDAYENFHMGNTGEIVAERYHVSRERQDEYALNSHRKAVAAIRAGRFRDEIVAVPIPQRKGDPVLFETDEAPRPDATIDALRALKPAFKKDGTVTAGNAPGVNDGAAAVVVTSAERAARNRDAVFWRRQCSRSRCRTIASGLYGHTNHCNHRRRHDGQWHCSYCRAFRIQGDPSRHCREFSRPRRFDYREESRARSSKRQDHRERQKCGPIPHQRRNSKFGAFGSRFRHRSRH